MNTLAQTSSWSEIFLLGLTDCRYSEKGVKRGVFKFLGEVSVIRLGTVDCDDAYCYSEQIERFEQNSESMTDRLEQQLCVVKLC
jgi:Ran GTPase-activating protein (RanGAP) involved in mRNA processing and transport